MRYHVAFTIPAGTPETDPARQVIGLAYGDITEVEILFPAGCSGKVHVAVFYHEHQIYPTNLGNSFVGDDTHITISDRYPITSLPLEVEVRGWSPDAELDHTVYVDFTVESAQLERTETVRYVSLPEGVL